MAMDDALAASAPARRRFGLRLWAVVAAVVPAVLSGALPFHSVEAEVREQMGSR